MLNDVQTPSASGLLESVAAAIERAALSGGMPSPPPEVSLPPATWFALLHGRRMRVFDWMVDAGFRLLNLLPDVGPRFMSFAQGQPLQHKYSVPRAFWRSVRGQVEDPGGWMEAIAMAEILLVELREAKSFTELRLGDADLVRLRDGVRLERIDPDTIALHETIPPFGLSASAAAAELEQLRHRLPHRLPVLRTVLVVPGWGDQPAGNLVELESDIAAALQRLQTGPVPVLELRETMSSEILTNLLALGAFSPCER